MAPVRRPGAPAPFCAPGDRTYTFLQPLERGVPVAPQMRAPARLTGPCRPAWRGKLELCGDGGDEAWDDGWEALFGEAAVRRRVARGAKMGAEEMMGGGVRDAAPLR